MREIRRESNFMLQENFITKSRLIFFIVLAMCRSTVLADTILLDTGLSRLPIR
jgi:hypothetical protein